MFARMTLDIPTLLAYFNYALFPLSSRIFH